MSIVSKILIGLASLAFLLAVFNVVFWPAFGIVAEAYSRASNNLALIAIALLLCTNRDTKST